MLFKYFPEIIYDKHKTKDITRHISFVKTLIRDPYTYLPYTLKDGEKPEDVSFYYYGTVEYTPYVMMANDVVNPYLDWLMTDEILHKHIIKKWKAKSNKSGDDILRWSLAANRFDNIIEFRSEDNKIKSIDTWIDEYVPDELQEAYYLAPETVNYVAYAGDWVPIRVYDWEVEQNESKRVINVVDISMIERVHSQFIEMINK